MISLCRRHDFIIRKAWTLSRLDLLYRFPSSTATRPTGPYPSVGFADISPSLEGSLPLPPKREGFLLSLRDISPLQGELPLKGKAFFGFHKIHGSREIYNFSRMVISIFIINTFSLIVKKIFRSREIK